MAEIVKPKLIFEVFQPGLRGGALSVRAIKVIFGGDNYNVFREAGKKEEYIPELTRQRVDSETYDRFGEMHGVRREGRERFWKRAMALSNKTIDYARGILFADQDRQATLTTNVAWSDERPSSALERLTMPTRLIGPQCRYEQGRQIVVGSLCAEITSEDENGDLKVRLSEVNDFLERELFIGRKGDPRKYHTFSYHTPQTNKLVGFSSRYPDPRFAEKLWVKSLDFPVRRVRMRDSAGAMAEVVSALYDPREKETEAIVVKALQRSLIAAKSQPNGGLIETTPYEGDRLGVRLVVMEGERPLRDRLTVYLEKLFPRLDGVYDICEDDEVDSNNGQPNRIEFRRRQVYINGLKHPLEVIIQTLSHYVSQLYEVGSFNPDSGMHDGPAHELYKLDVTFPVAKYFWPYRFFGIDLAAAKKSASYEYATRLGRKQRIYPSPYLV